VDLQAWVEDNCPSLWKVLNTKARMHLPTGLVDYISIGSQSEIGAGRDHILSIDWHLSLLSNECGWKNISDKYRRDLSGLSSEKQVAELFCEIALCASIH